MPHASSARRGTGAGSATDEPTRESRTMPNAKRHDSVQKRRRDRGRDADIVTRTGRPGAAWAARLACT